MTLTVRLPDPLQALLDSYCKAKRVTKSKLVIDLLAEHLSAPGVSGQSRFALAKSLGVVGSFASGKGELSERRKALLKDKLRAKHAR